MSKVQPPTVHTNYPRLTCLLPVIMKVFVKCFLNGKINPCIFVFYLAAIVVLFVALRRQKKEPLIVFEEEDIRENIITYDDEGGGEEDTEAFDIATLQVRVRGRVAITILVLKIKVYGEKRKLRVCCFSLRQVKSNLWLSVSAYAYKHYTKNLQVLKVEY